VNEAGAHIFENYSDELNRSGKYLLSAHIIRNIERSFNMTLKAETGTMIELIFKGIVIHYDFQRRRHALCDRNKIIRQAALAAAAISLEKNGFDVNATLRELLNEPRFVIEKIRKLGEEGALESLQKTAKLSDSADMVEVACSPSALSGVW